MFDVKTTRASYNNERGPGLSRDRLRGLNMAAEAREIFRQQDFDPDAPAVKRAIAKRERIAERNRKLGEKGAHKMFVPQSID